MKRQSVKFPGTSTIWENKTYKLKKSIARTGHVTHAGRHPKLSKSLPKKNNKFIVLKRELKCNSETVKYNGNMQKTVMKV